MCWKWNSFCVLFQPSWVIEKPRWWRTRCTKIFTSVVSFKVLERLENLNPFWKCVEIGIPSVSCFNHLGSLSFVKCLHTKRFFILYPEAKFCYIWLTISFVSRIVKHSLFSQSLTQTHTHTHIYIYIYNADKYILDICIYLIQGKYYSIFLTAWWMLL